MIILGIETSCDETALCILEVKDTADGRISYRILEHLISSQAQIHSEYGGVFPMLAKREHAKNIVPMLETLISSSAVANITENISQDQNSQNKVEAIQYLEKNEPSLLEAFDRSTAGLRKIKIDRIAITVGPGLEPALWVGVNFAKALGILWNTPIVPINHMEGHIVGSFIENDEPSAEFYNLKKIPETSLALLISGGHTELVKVTTNNHTSDQHYSHTLLGSTRDDALGEAYDKVARMLGLPYPGGPQVSALANKYRESHTDTSTGDATDTHNLKFPRPMIDSKDYDFSFAGLKTSVLYYLRSQMKRDPYAPQKMRHDVFEVAEDTKELICYEFEEAITDVIITKTKAAITATGAKSLIVGGGVIANNYLRKKLAALADDFSIPILLPSKTVSGDNALMIALAGALMPENKTVNKINFDQIKVSGHLAFV